MVTGDAADKDTDFVCGTEKEMTWTALTTENNWDKQHDKAGTFWLSLAAAPNCTASVSLAKPVVEEASVRTTVTGLGIATLAISSLYM